MEPHLIQLAPVEVVPGPRGQLLAAELATAHVGDQRAGWTVGYLLPDQRVGRDHPDGIAFAEHPQADHGDIVTVEAAYLTRS